MSVRRPMRETRTAMGMPVTIDVRDTGVDRSALEAALWSIRAVAGRRTAC
jgi:hypothetical protein